MLYVDVVCVKLFQLNKYFFLCLFYTIQGEERNEVIHLNQQQHFPDSVNIFYVHFYSTRKMISFLKQGKKKSNNKMKIE